MGKGPGQGHSPRQHGVEQNAQAPDVTAFIIALALQHLATGQGRWSVWGAVESHHRCFLLLPSRAGQGSQAQARSPLASWAKVTEAGVLANVGPLGGGTRPPVPRTLTAEEAVPLTSGATHLRRHEVGCVARCHEEPVLSPQLFGKTKVTDAQALGIPGLVHIQDVAGLQVPVHNLGAGAGVSSQCGEAASGPGQLPGMRKLPKQDECTDLASKRRGRG